MNATSNLVEDLAVLRLRLRLRSAAARRRSPRGIQKAQRRILAGALHDAGGHYGGRQGRRGPPQSVGRFASVLKARGRNVLLIHREDGDHSTNYDDARAILEFVIQKARPGTARHD